MKYSALVAALFALALTACGEKAAESSTAAPVVAAPAAATEAAAPTAAPAAATEAAAPAAADAMKK